MPTRTMVFIALAGILLSVAGWLWGVYFVGVPYQDPSPAQRASEAMHMNIMTWTMLVGAGMLLAAGLIAVFRLACALFKRMTQR